MKLRKAVDGYGYPRSIRQVRRGASVFCLVRKTTVIFTPRRVPILGSGEPFRQNSRQNLIQIYCFEKCSEALLLRKALVPRLRICKKLGSKLEAAHERILDHDVSDRLKSFIVEKDLLEVLLLKNWYNSDHVDEVVLDILDNEGEYDLWDMDDDDPAKIDEDGPKDTSDDPY